MSIFTGKCDLYDSVEMLDGGFKNFMSRYKNGVTIEVGDKKFDVMSRDDILPYYTYLVAVMTCTNDKCYIRLSSRPYTQTLIEERKELIKRYKNGIKRWSKNPEKNQRKIAWAEKDIRSLERCIKWIEDLEQKFAKYVELNRGKDEEVWLW
jgi:hypothetical protein